MHESVCRRLGCDSRYDREESRAAVAPVRFTFDVFKPNSDAVMHEHELFSAAMSVDSRTTDARAA